MATTVQKTIGAGQDYTTLQAWEDAMGPDCTASRTGTTVTGSTSSTIVLDALASGTTDFYKGHAVWADARSSEKRLITAYDGTTKVATIGALNGSSATWDNIPGVEAFTVDTTIWQGRAINQEFTFSGGSAQLTLSGVTTSATAYLELTTATGASFQDHASVRTNALRYNSANGACFNFTPAGYFNWITGNQDYFRLNKIQMKGADIGGHGVFVGTGSIIKDCIFEIATSSKYFITSGGAQAVNAINCVFIARGAAQRGLLIGTGSKAIGCTLVKPTTFTDSSGVNAFTGAYGAMQITDCAVFGFTTGFTDNPSPTGGNNGTDLASGAPGTGNQYSITYSATTPFTEASNTNTDLRAIASTSLAANGTLDSTNAPNDISNTARPSTPTIGAWELQSGVAATINAEAGAYTVTGADDGNIITRNFNAEAGSYAATGAATTFGREMNAVAGAYTITGADATLQTNIATAYTINAAAGSYDVVGVDFGIINELGLNAAPGVYETTGADATQKRGYTANAEAGAYGVTGRPAYLKGPTDPDFAAGGGSRTRARWRVR